MRKFLGILSVSLLVLSTSSCGNKQETETISVDTLGTASTMGSAIEQVASDKEKLRQAIILASTKGTLDDALAEAALDSVVGDQLRAALVTAAGNARTASSTTTSGKKSASTAAKTPAQQKKDAIDQANDALDKTNRTIDRTTETVDKATEAARKADELLRRR